jgi:hypothetical protein
LVHPQVGFFSTNPSPAPELLPATNARIEDECFFYKSLVHPQVGFFSTNSSPAPKLLPATNEPPASPRTLTFQYISFP